MLKGLKNKKDGKGQPKKDTKKDKQTKKQVKKQTQQQQQETNDVLVDINYQEKQTNNTKKINKIQSSKLEQKQIDVSNIPVEKKQQVKPLTSWVVDADKVNDVFKQKFDMNKVDTEFESLTNTKLNQQLAQKAKKQAEQNKNKVVEQKGGLKFAVLQKPAVIGGRSDGPELNIRKPERVDVNANLNPQIAVTSINPPQFHNSAGGFAKIEKTAQQLREEQLDKKMQLAPKTKGWLGGNKNKEQSQPQPEFKVSGWAQKANEEISAPVKFAPLEKAQPISMRQQQQFVFVSKKDQEERRRKREQREQAQKAGKA